jgi:hypothetical protein
MLLNSLTKELTLKLNKYFESKIEIPRIEWANGRLLRH